MARRTSPVSQIRVIGVSGLLVGALVAATLALTASPVSADITPATTARVIAGVPEVFEGLPSVTTDGVNLYAIDSGGHRIRIVSLATGAVSTLASGFGSLGSVATDGINVYVTDGNRIRQVVIATGAITTLAGTTNAGSDDGTGSVARFNQPDGVATDGTSVYVADMANEAIRKVVIATGEVTTFVGKRGTAGFGDGVGQDARFDHPRGLAILGTVMFVADTFNSTIRKVDLPTAEVTTIAGVAGDPGSANGPPGVNRFNQPRGVVAIGSTVYVADTANNILRTVDLTTGSASFLAGRLFGNGDTDGVGPDARFRSPTGLTTDGTSVWVADFTNSRIRKVDPATALVTTLPTTVSEQVAPSFSLPSNVVNVGGHLYVLDEENREIARVTIATGEVTTFAGDRFGNDTSLDGIGTAARFRRITGLATDGANLYVTESFQGRIRKIVLATAEVTTISGATGSGSIDGPMASARYAAPDALATDGTDIYVADRNNHTIRRINLPTQTVTTLAGTSGTPGQADGVGAAARFLFPQGLTLDGPNLYVADTGNQTIRRVVVATGEVTTVAGMAQVAGSADGIGAAAGFNRPLGLASDGTSLFVSDVGNARVRKITLATRQVTTLSGASGPTTYLPTTTPTPVGSVEVSAAGGLAFSGDGRQLFATVSAGIVAIGHPATPGDFDGNGTADIGVFRPSNGVWYLHGQAAVGFGVAGDVPVPGDYDGDGDTDVAVYRPSNGVWYVLGQGAFGYGVPGDIPVPGDYDGDGDTDIAVFRPSNGVWYVLGQAAVGFGVAGDVPVPADYDGDGDTDVAVYRPSNGVWYVLGQAALGYGGTAGDVPVPGDYDGDGDTDVAVFRPSEGIWYVLGLPPIGYGVAGDIPVPADYDGDGDTDVAAYRPSTGVWYVLGQTGAVGYGEPGDVPVARRPELPSGGA